MAILNYPNFKTIFVVIFYTLISYLVMFSCVAQPNLILSFLISIIFNLVSTTVFLYLFTNKKTSNFAKKIEQSKKKNQQKYLEKFLRFGKFLTCIILSFIGGPILLALTIKLIFNKSSHKYLIAVIACTISTFIFISFSKGLFQLIF